MGTDKNIKLHIVTDIKTNLHWKSTWTDIVTCNKGAVVMAEQMK